MAAAQTTSALISDNSGSRRRPAPDDVEKRIQIPPAIDFDDDDDVDETLAVCAVGQLASAALFAFLFGAVGFVLQGGDTMRNVLWFICTAAGAVLGLTAAKGVTTRTNSSTILGWMYIRFGVPAPITSFAITILGSIVGLGGYTLLPPLPQDHLIASVVAGGSTWVVHPLADVAFEAYKNGVKTIGLHTFVSAASKCGPELPVVTSALPK